MSDDFTRRQMDEADRRQQREWADNTRKHAEEVAQEALRRPARRSNNDDAGSPGRSSGSSGDIWNYVIGISLGIALLAALAYGASMLVR